MGQNPQRGEKVFLSHLTYEAAQKIGLEIANAFVNAGIGLGSGGGGSAGGGNNTYSTEQGDFTATVTNGTYEIVLSVDSIGGENITESNFANGILKIWDDSAGEIKTVTLDKPIWTSGTKTLDITDCTDAFLLNTGDLVSLTLTGPDKGYDETTDDFKYKRSNPEWAHYIDPVLDINETSGTASQVRYSSIIVGDSYRNMTFQFYSSDESTGTTFKIYATLDEDATQPSAGSSPGVTWVDISSDVLGASSITLDGTTDAYIIDLPTMFKYFMVQYETSDTAQDVKIWYNQY